MTDIPTYGGGTGDTTTGSSTSSEPTGPSEAEIAARRNMEVAFRAILQSLGLPLTENLRKLINKAVVQMWNSTTFTYYLRRTREYHQEFPGNTNKDGTTNLSEAAYIARVAQYKDAAALIGMRVSPKMIQILIKKQISPQLFADRARGVKAMRQNPGLFENFGEYVAARFGKTKPPTKKELLKFAIGLGPKKWNDAYDIAYASNQIEEAGIDVGPGEDINFRELKRIVKDGDVEAADYAQLAFMAQHALPASKLYGMGITKKDLVRLAFGGPDAQILSDRVKQALGTYEAAVTEKTAQPQMAQSQSGTQVLTGRRPVQATE